MSIFSKKLPLAYPVKLLLWRSLALSQSHFHKAFREFLRQSLPASSLFVFRMNQTQLLCVAPEFENFKMTGCRFLLMHNFQHPSV